MAGRMPRATPLSLRSVAANPTVRAFAYQVLLALALIALVWWAARNVANNLAAANITSGFGFLWATAQFDISQSLIPFEASMSYGRALLVGLLNTLLVSAIGIVFATLLGFSLGVARLSRNPLLSRLAHGYVEIVRNVPLLLQLLFWYNAVLKPLPSPRQSIALGDIAFLNNRGLYVPRPEVSGALAAPGLALLVALVAVIMLSRLSRRRRDETGRGLPLLPLAGLLIVGLPLLTAAIAGSGVSLSYPTLRGFNFSGGMTLMPEFVALVIGLSTYTAAFIAEVVRAGIASVAKGQTEAAQALGLSSGLTTRLIIIPQALRLIVPPLTNQFLNLTKNSSLAVAIGYPDLVQIGAGPVLQNSGQALEVISLIMLVYLLISLATSFGMNLYNSAIALKER